MNSGKFDRWVEAYGRAWETKDPEAAADLFVEDATYQETPFDEPMRGSAEITEYWSSVTGSQDEIRFSYEILAASAGEGIAHWGANFVRLANGTPVRSTASCSRSWTRMDAAPSSASGGTRSSRKGASMDFGVTLQTDPPAWRVVELARKAEALGFTYAWTFDSHILWQEPYVIYSQILSATESMIVGPLVTNPATRDPSVTASTFATLNDMFGNRTICGIGRGDSAQRVLGRKPTRLAEVEEAMHVIKELAEGREIDYDGTKVRIPWVSNGKLDVWMAGYGPKALSTIGRKADGFILQLADPVILEWTMRHVNDAATEAGRNPDDVKVCVAAPAYVGDNLAHQRDQCRWFGGMVGNHVADLVSRYGEDGEIPHALTDYIRAREGYDYGHHGKADNLSTNFVPDNIVDRFCVLGTVEDHVAKLNELKDLGVDQFNIYLMHDAMEETLEAYGEEIIPALGSKTAR